MNNYRPSLVAAMVLGLAVTASASSQAVKAFNKSLGHGVNLGNLLEAPSEGSWGVTLEPTDIPLIAAKGFNSIRVPIRWDGNGNQDDPDFDRALRTPPYTVDPRFFERVDSVISWARQNHLVVVINDHHHDSLFSNYEYEKPRFLAIWAQIAERYKNMPIDTVGFEILNEPNSQVTATVWNTLLDTTLKIIRQTNPNRPVVIGTAEWGGMGAMGALKIPDDSNLILTVHDYNPFTFTHQGASWVTPAIPVGTKWGGYWDLRQATDDIQRIADFAKSVDLPVWIGEFGALPTKDTVSRNRWAATKSRLYEKAGFSWAWWEFKAGFGVYKPAVRKWNNELVGALLSNDTSFLVLPPAPTDDSDIAINGNFELDTGWAINLPAGKATFSVDSGSGLVVVDSATPGTSWGIQLVQAPLKVKKGSSYVLTFVAWADTTVSIDASVGMNQEPWANFGSSNGLRIGKQPKSFFTGFQVSFDDSISRICFNLGNTKARIRIDSVRLLEYRAPPVSVRNPIRSASGFLAKGRVLVSTAAAMPLSRHLLDAQGTVVGPLNWVRQGKGWEARLESAPRNQILFLDKESHRIFLQ